VAGIGGYGNCLGLPNIGGEVVFDACYASNPLVNALCVGVLKHEDLQFAHAEGVGNKVIMYGAATGGDGIGGASVLASETFTETGPTKRPSVQVGDPFMEKLLIECTLELFQAGVVEALQDFGAAGISCATSELASTGSGGMHVELDLVPLRDSTLSPEEILMSESQERMMAIVEPAKVEQFMAICAKWDVLATVVGEVTDGDRLHIDWHGERIVDVDPKTVAVDSPVYDRPAARPDWIDAVNADSANALPRATSIEELRQQVIDVVTSPNLADKSWITNQYDRYVRGGSALTQPENSGMLRIDEQTNLGIALSCDGNGRYTFLNPYLGAQLALAEAYRNVATTGAEPVAVTDCLNFGSPEDPEIMWQFIEAIRGLVDACQELGVPVTGGNVSFYNKTGEQSILPTPVIGVLGVIDDVRQHSQLGFTTEGDIVVLLGETREDLSATVWEDVCHDHHLGGMPPSLDLQHEVRLGKLLQAGVQQGLLCSAHDLSEGGLIQALVESCFRRGMGAKVALPSGDLTVQLFAETAGRVLVSVAAERVAELEQLAAQHEVPLQVLGVVSAEQQLSFAGQFDLDLVELKAQWQRTIPEALGL
ncbi:MAG: phosphoribosylformylglycinamidine synthase subunit PurL, partial [Propionibacteriaceae bacterium]